MNENIAVRLQKYTEVCHLCIGSSTYTLMATLIGTAVHLLIYESSELERI